MKKVTNNNSSEAVEINHTTYIKFDYHNNDFMLAAMDAVQTIFRNDLFDVAMSWYSNSPIKDDDNFKCIDIDTKLHEEEIALIYNKKFLTKAPTKFIKDYININIK